ncbi:hypothetical protein B0O99DRAFT_604065 [Bisporella sp. PMI_857]|nr:hypothetical protein B0O99DRAFT_604065 [Bisporella sp. PMI_857]
MGWFDNSSVADWAPSSSKRHRSRSPKRYNSSSGSIFGSGHAKHNASSHSIFGAGDHRHNSSRSSFFGNFGKTSHYKRSPRPGYLQSAYKKLRRLLRDLIHYAKKHPIKVFMLVIMPLITGGALTGLLARFGVRLPYSVEKMLGIAGGAAGSFGGGGLGGNERSTFGQAIGRDRHGNLMFEREREAAEGPLSAFGGLAGLMGGAGSAYKVAKMFM